MSYFSFRFNFGAFDTRRQRGSFLSKNWGTDKIAPTMEHPTMSIVLLASV